MTQLSLPDTMALFPWGERRVNPLRHDVVPESGTWIASFESFETDTKRKVVEEDFGMQIWGSRILKATLG